ncbi:MAG: hypothetical protein JW827_03795 [Spirochaetes bacterium]|nr:hypothetical protein [Spirochaetota bacterium]
MMKKIIFIIILFMIFPHLHAQLTNRSYWEYGDEYLNLFSSSNSLITNFYKFLVTYENWYQDININRVSTINAFPGDNLYLRHYIYNVGDINETQGVNLRVGTTNTNFNIRIYESTTNVMITNTPPVNSGASTSYIVALSVPTNFSGTFTFWITNTGSTNGPPYPARVIVQHTLNVIRLGVAPVRATDQIHEVTVFDGTQPLGNLDSTIFIRIQGSVLDPGSVRLYYDMNGTPDGSAPTGAIDRNRSITLSRDGDYWIGVIPATDPEVQAGSMVNFIISVDGRLYDRNGIVIIGAVSPWRYPIREYATQPESPSTISINNRFNPQAGEEYAVIYKLNRGSHVNISIYNIRGELVRNLKNEQQPLGKHVVKWDGKNDDGETVAVGLYLVVLQSNEFGDIRKVIVVNR